MRKHSGILILIATMLLTFFVPFTAVRINAEVVTGTDGNTYQISSSGASLDKWKTGVSGAVTIPDSITYNGQTYKVWKINNSAFYDPTNPNDYTGITSVTIGKNVQTIESHAFDSCTGITKVSFKSGSVCTTIENDAFADCTSLTTVTLPAGLKKIGSSAFVRCSKLNSINIPSSVTEIGFSAFLQCSALTSISLSSSLTSLGSGVTGVFEQCTSLKTIDMSMCSRLTTIPDITFKQCSALTNVSFPPALTTIGSHAFENCSSLTEIRLPATIKTIGEAAFNSSGVKNATILATTAPTISYDRGAQNKNSFKLTTNFTVPANATGYDSGKWTGYAKRVSYVNGLAPATATPTTKPSSGGATPTTKPATATPTTRPSSGNATPTRRPSATVTPKPTTPGGSRATATPTPRPSSSGSSSSSSSNPGVADFIERLYTVALGRASDPYGKADWVNRVRTQGYTGADLARGFLFSDEFLGKNMSDSAFLDVLYMTFFNRAADSQKSYWQGLLDQGWTKKQVIDGFINSTEWANLCLTYGIASGTNCPPNIVIQPSADVVAFAKRLYTTCLGRNPDTNGLNNWASALANMQISGSEAAHGFFFSAEFINAGHSDSEYVTRLYRTFMGREPDQGGYNNWMSALSSGQSREAVFQGFAGSAEWAGICAEYGILK